MRPKPSCPNFDRSSVERLLRELYGARTAAELDRLCALFAPEAFFRIAGSSDGKPISITARGTAEIASWLGVLVKTFKISRHEIMSTLIDGTRAAVQWRASIHSRITGVDVATELVDVVETREGLITSYVELFVPE